MAKCNILKCVTEQLYTEVLLCCRGGLAYESSNVRKHVC